MRTFEIILLVTITLLPFMKRRILGMIASKYVAGIIGLILILHLVFEGYRWTMVPAYLVAAILMWRIVSIDPTKKVKLSFFRILGFIAFSFMLTAAWFFPHALPVFELPEPQGQFLVGTASEYYQTDFNEVITQDPSDKRELTYKLWFPVDTESELKERDVYLDFASRSGFAVKYGLPSFAFNYLDLVETQVYTGISPADGKFPVLIFSHGYGSKATGYYALLTEIASNGYIIVNMNHTYESLGVTMPDGEIKYFDFGYQREQSKGSMEVVNPLIDAFKAGLSYEQRHPIVRDVVKVYFEGDIQNRWARDIGVTLDLLKEWNAEGPLKGKMDLDKIGVFGHSVGGGTAGNIAMKDRRIKAAANLDGIQWGDMIDSAYHIPYLYVSADWPAEHEDINSHVYINKGDSYFYESRLLNSGHPNFMDIPLMIPIRQIAGTGAIDPYEGNEIAAKLVTSFFDRHLKQLPDSNPLDVGEEFALLEIQLYEGDSIK